MKKLVTLLLVLLLALSVVSISSAAGEPEHVFRFAVAAMPTVAHSQAVEVFAEELGKLTDGKIKVETYFGGSLFAQEGQQNAVARGALEFTNTGFNWLADHVPYLSMVASAYLFEDYEHMTSVLNGEIGVGIAEDVAEKTNIRILSVMYMGTRQLNLRDIGRVVKTPADMKGVKLRMPNSRSWLFMGEALGANPTPVNINELYMALKTGTVDGQDNPLPNSIKRKFYEVTKYTILTGHYVNPIIIVMNEKKFQELIPEYQEAVMAAADKAREFCDNLIMEQEEEGYDLLEEKGMEFVEVDQALWKDHVLNYYLESDMSEDWDMDLYEEIQAAAE